MHTCHVFTIFGQISDSNDFHFKIRHPPFDDTNSYKVIDSVGFCVAFIFANTLNFGMKAFICLRKRSTTLPRL